MPRLGVLDDCKNLTTQLHALEEKQHRVGAELQECFRHRSELARQQRHAEQVAKHVLCQSKGDLIAVHYFLEKTLSAFGNKVIAECFASILAYASGLSAEELCGLREPTALKTKPNLGRSAERFLKENHLQCWVSNLNMQHSIAPTVSLVADEAKAAGCMSSERATMKHKYQLQWLRRWRRRWNISLASIAAREHVQPEEARQKVTSFHELPDRHHFVTEFRQHTEDDVKTKQGPLCGPQFGSSFCFSS